MSMFGFGLQVREGNVFYSSGSQSQHRITGIETKGLCKVSVWEIREEKQKRRSGGIEQCQVLELLTDCEVWNPSVFFKQTI